MSDQTLDWTKNISVFFFSFSSWQIVAACSGSNKLDHDYALVDFGGGVTIRGRGFTFENEVSIIVPFAMLELVLYLGNGVI